MNLLEFLRQFRFNNYAIFDISVAFLGMYLLSPLIIKFFLKIKIKLAKKDILFLVLPFGIFVHLIIGNYTSMTKDFINLQGHYILKVLILVLLILGIKDIKIIKHEKQNIN